MWNAIGAWLVWLRESWQSLALALAAKKATSRVTWPDTGATVHIVRVSVLWFVLAMGRRGKRVLSLAHHRVCRAGTSGSYLRGPDLLQRQSKDVSERASGFPRSR